MFWKRKRRIESKELARILEEEFVAATPVRAAKGLQLNEENRVRFEEKARLYGKAVILLVLAMEEKKSAGFASVREHFERLVFPSSQEKGQAIFADIKTAMRGFNSLLEEKKEMSWARTWLHDTGVSETNPAALALFASYWMDLFAIVTKALRESQPT